jgi:uncharacterized linocin/CFP29 family protein
VNLGRETVGWTADVWARLDKAVHDEMNLALVAAKFIPLEGPLEGALTVPAELIDPDTMTISETAVLPMIELSVGFGLTQEQTESEAQLGTAVTLATRAANLLAQAEDLLIFQGDAALAAAVFKTVQVRGSGGPGLLAAAAYALGVPAVDLPHRRYGENVFAAVVSAIAYLETKGHYGPYALVLQSTVYADTLVPIPGTLLMPADQIKPLLERGFLAAGAMAPSTGLLVSLGGASIDLVVGVDPVTAFVQIDADGMYRFRVFERMTTRLKDPSALVRFDFEKAK